MPGMDVLAELSPPVFFAVLAGLFVTWVFLIRRFYYRPRKP
jgi:hypothetical protein